MDSLKISSYRLWEGQIVNTRILRRGCVALADPRGATSARPPKQDPILSFLHTFSPKSACVGGTTFNTTGWNNPDYSTDFALLWKGGLGQLVY